MPKRLPPDHSITAMRQLAADLADGVASRDPAALRRIRATHPSASDEGEIGTFGNEDAQLIVAREHGFASWRQLAVFVEPKDDDDFLRLACLHYDHRDRPANWQRAAGLLEGNPALGERDIWHAAATGNVAAAERLLDAEPGLANALGGCRDWPPLLYACYSRLAGTGDGTLAVARLLLERGADPNAHFMWGAQYRFTALTGVFGEGEMGPVNQPPHPHWQALARLLLDAGADANDSQALYNTMFTPGSDCLILLLEHGLKASDCNNWLDDEGDELVPGRTQTLGYQLAFAVKNHHVDRAKLLIDQGAELGDLNDGMALAECAHLGGHPELADYLVAHGARAGQIDAPMRFAGRSMAGDLDAAKAMLAEAPGLVAQAQAAWPNLLADAAAGDRHDAVRTMLSVGFDASIPDRTALHQAAFHGHLEVARLLVEGGANLGARDAGFAATPLQWALVAGQTEVADYFATLPIGVFDAALCENTERLAALLAADAGVLATTIGATRPGAPAHADDWQTPLAFAALRDKRAAVRWLLAHGADPKVQDPAGVPLLNHVRAAGNEAVAALLSAAADAAPQ